MALDNFKNSWDRIKSRHGSARVNTFALILVVGVASLAVRMLMHYRFHTSALLYVGIPYLISLAIVINRPMTPRTKWWQEYRDHSLSALAVFFASSIVLFEGFVCILFFLPIYYLGVSIVFFAHWIVLTRRRRRGSTLVSVLPLLILASSFEGTTESLSFNRDSHVVATKITHLSPQQVMQNIASPFDLKKDRDWLIAVFPMPYEIDAGSLDAGDVHIVRTRYHRWFVTNTHEGELHLQIVDVQPNRVRTRFVHDSSFFASYLTPIGTEITLTELAANKTEISLRIDYERKLDPAWYFHPLQQYVVGQMAEFLIDEVMIRD